jgi:hypothetical protein
MKNTLKKFLLLCMALCLPILLGLKVKAGNQESAVPQVLTSKFDTTTAADISTQRIVLISVAQVSSVDRGKASVTPKQFRLTVNHDAKIIPSEILATFNRTNSVLLGSLSVKRTYSDGSSEDATDDFNFTLEKSTVPSTLSSNWNTTVYISDEITVTKAQTLIFTIDLTDYARVTQPTIDPALILTSVDRLRFESAEVALSSLALNGTSLILEPTEDSSKKKLVLEAPDTVSISGVFSGSNVASTVDSLSFVGISDSSALSNPQIKFSSSKATGTLRMAVSADNGDASISSAGDDGAYTVNIPCSIGFSGSRNAFLARQDLLDSISSKTLKIPISFYATDNGLDLQVSGNLSQSVSFSFLDDPIFLEKSSAKARKSGVGSLKLYFKYSNTVPAKVDPLVLELRFLDTNGNLVNNQALQIQNVSKVKSSNAQTYKTILIGGAGLDLSSILEQAVKVDLRIKRSDSYLEGLGINSSDTTNHPSLATNDRNQLILDLL